MAIIKRKLIRKNTDGTLDDIHLQTSSDQVLIGETNLTNHLTNYTQSAGRTFSTPSFREKLGIYAKLEPWMYVMPQMGVQSGTVALTKKYVITSDMLKCYHDSNGKNTFNFSDYLEFAEDYFDNGFPLTYTFYSDVSLCYVSMYTAVRCHTSMPSDWKDISISCSVDPCLLMPEELASQPYVQSATIMHMDHTLPDMISGYTTGRSGLMPGSDNIKYDIGVHAFPLRKSSSTQTILSLIFDKPLTADIGDTTIGSRGTGFMMASSKIYYPIIGVANKVTVQSTDIKLTNTDFFTDIADANQYFHVYE